MRGLLVLLLLGGCAVQRLDRDKDALARGDHAAIAGRPPPCAGPAPECRQAQAIRAEACAALGRLECAVAAYRAAVGPGAPRPLLLGLGHAAMQALAKGAGDPAGMIAAQRLAADGLRREAPADPEGCYLAGSAQLGAALLRPPGAGRCESLAAIPAACRAAAPVPGREAQSRLLAAALADQTRSQGCP